MTVNLWNDDGMSADIDQEHVQNVIDMLSTPNIRFDMDVWVDHDDFSIVDNENSSRLYGTKDITKVCGSTIGLMHIMGTLALPPAPFISNSVYCSLGEYLIKGYNEYKGDRSALFNHVVTLGEFIDCRDTYSDIDASDPVPINLVIRRLKLLQQNILVYFKDNKVWFNNVTERMLSMSISEISRIT